MPQCCIQLLPAVPDQSLGGAERSANDWTWCQKCVRVLLTCVASAVTTVPAMPNLNDVPVRCGLGLTFREEMTTGLLIVHSITPGGGAANCGTIQVCLSPDASSCDCGMFSVLRVLLC